jgi:N-acetylmuramoyl-L-alanine amidase
MLGAQGNGRFHHLRRISAKLFAVRISFWLIAFLLVPFGSGLTDRQTAQQESLPSTPGAGSPQAPPAQLPPNPLPTPAQPSYSGPVIVIDPAHGGTDPGARGQNGPIEKEIVQQFARAVRVELVRQGYRVALTRDDDSNPSYDDRAAFANSYHDAIVVSLHVSSTGAAGTARVYYYQFWNPFPAQSKAPAQDSGPSDAPTLSYPVVGPSLIPWNEAQRLYANASHRLADQLQIQLAQAFAGSPALSKGAAIRGLRSVAAPAVAIEVSCVTDSNAASLSAMAAPLAGSVAKGIQKFRTGPPAGAN